MPTYAVLGSGGWGTAIAVMLAHKPGNVVRLWCAHATTADLLSERRENTRQLAGVPIPRIGGDYHGPRCRCCGRGLLDCGDSDRVFTDHHHPVSGLGEVWRSRCQPHEGN